MFGNSVLNRAKYSEGTDEWYTPYEIIAEELEHYEEEFFNKNVLCNCDDPFKSQFVQYFLKNFNRLKLKELICTSYVESGKGYLLQVKDVESDFEINTVLESVKKLEGNGDFRSDECVEYLKRCDICCTNPPFSLFSELFSLLVKYDKKFLIIGNQNAITYKEIFPLIRDNKVWVGYRFGDMKFLVSENTAPRKYRFWIDEHGQKWRSLGNAMWLTNLDTFKRHEKFELFERYSPLKYQSYDNFNAINVEKVHDIPKDFNGIMGVPITFLKYHNGQQFEIVGEANHGSDNEFDLFKPKINGKEIFKRILIRRKQNNIMKFKVLDLFCGAGGFSYGMDKNPNFQTIIALDVDDKAALTFQKNIPNAKVIVGDITDKNTQSEIIRLAKQEKVNMIIGGPPCQGYSMKGKKLGLKDPRNFLFKEFLNIVKEIEPEVFVIENVKGILLSENGWFKNEIVDSIKGMGYFVEFGILNAADFGVPQSRERAIFICSKHIKIPLPNPTVKTFSTVRDAISDLAYLESGEGNFEQKYITAPESNFQKLMRCGCTILYNHKASNHKEVAINKLKLIPPEQGKEFLPQEMIGKQKFKTTWGRLKWDELSPTIDTRFDAASNGTNNHPFLNRAITPREAARLQSFDDSFIFFGSKVYIRKQIGNAVPPLMANAIANQIDFKINFDTKGAE